MKTYTIGRNAGKTICFSNPDVSGDHAEIVENNGSYLLIDHSKNGTIVNGNRVHRASFPIKRGDVILFGNGAVLNWSLIR
ncbi:MAG: FHA domain-containing protein [Bacteroidales bacterium]|nr:FHA domain-containing protein [Bacteroidales bacterium]